MATDKREYKSDGTEKRKEALIAGQRSDGDFQYFLINDNGIIPVDTSDKQQIKDSTTSAGTWISLDLGDVKNGVDIAVDTSGAATLTIQVSTTGDFGGEQFEVRTIDYSSAVVNLEQFTFRHQYVRCKADANLNDLEMVARGD